MDKTENKYDLIIVGAGIAGLYMLHKIQTYTDMSVKLLESASEIGGTWYWNRYPGARCDVESMQYSYAFSKELQQEWEWTEQYATQPEILKYINHVADKYNLREKIDFNSKVLSLIFNEKTGLWKIQTNDKRKLFAKFCIMATGCLSSPYTPTFKGIKKFLGPVYHTGKWPKENVSFFDKTVGIIGTGSSAIQSIPIIAEEAKHLFVFQRTPHYTVPARNRKLNYNSSLDKSNYKEPKGFGFDKDLSVEEIKAGYDKLRQKANSMFSAMAFPLNAKSALEVSQKEREEEYEKRWNMGGVPFIGSFSDLNTNRQANETAASFVRNKIQSIVKNPIIAKILTPSYAIGCKRLAVDTDYYKTFNRKNVTLVDLSKTSISEITTKGVLVGHNLFEIDSLIMATGFDAMTGALLNINIVGKEGLTLQEKWENGPKSYLGLAIEGFPNLFTITGPGSPSVFTNMIISIEQHVDWIYECLKYMKKNKISEIEASSMAENDWAEYNGSVAKDHIRSSCNSWYMGSNIEGKPNIFMPFIGGFPEYIKICNQIASDDYDGFRLK